MPVDLGSRRGAERIDVREPDAVSFAVEIAIEGDVSVARLSGELDMATAPMLAEALAATTRTMRQRLVLDLSNLDFVDCAGLRAIVGARNALRSRSGELTLQAPSPFAARILEITGLVALMTEFAPEGHALLLRRGLAAPNVTTTFHELDDRLQGAPR